MCWLELRIPPVAVLLICGMMMYSSVLLVPTLNLQIESSFLFFTAIFFVILGSVIVFLCALIFSRVDTTVNPLKPDQTSTLVMTGIYQYSRNPIYLGLVLMLLGWGIYLSNILGLAFIVGFVQYMNHFQIEPEERALSKLFGEQYTQYQSEVRRWL